MALTCDIPLLVYPILRVLYPLVWKQNYHDSSRSRKVFTVSGNINLVILLSAMGLSFGAAHAYTLVLNVVGILSCVYISGVLPCALYLKQAPAGDPMWLKWTSFGVLVVTIFMGLFAFTFIVSDGESFHHNKVY